MTAPHSLQLRPNRKRKRPNWLQVNPKRKNYDQIQAVRRQLQIERGGNTAAHRSTEQWNNHVVKQRRVSMPTRQNHVRFHHVPEKGQMGTHACHARPMAKATCELLTQTHRQSSMTSRDKGTIARTVQATYWLVENRSILKYGHKCII
ncbi:hypothetical protein CSKR_203280 [Clonorchis sinensis]|uniref:Uncharacterized protein n=1 Tax=Clonorchis sinensis TaxID=79923 RepID=A0A8T1M952_CLOSI|nr:hypothetical protein CSKR_203280 [Clonorchis sinensis]